MGQTDDLAPADRRIYALRDVTATVESIPLITASILSKKLAEDVDGIVLDVKTGSGAFMPTIEKARDLARSIVDVSRKMKMKIVVLITDMEQPLGRAIGNALEIRECIDFLKGNAAEDLETVSLALAAHMIRLGGRAKSLQQASKMAYEAVSKGAASDKFKQIIQAQGGDARVVDNPDLLPRTPFVDEFRSPRGGFVTRCDAKLLGLASNALGAGRDRVHDVVHSAVGLYLERKTGDAVKRGDTLCRIHWNDERRLQSAIALIEKAFEVKARPLPQRPLIHATLEG
jgi:pyrimidine-nucleoside phosphorylase